MKPRLFDTIILHCFAPPNGENADIETIREQHLASGLKDIGYHYVITERGEVQKGLPVDAAGAHCKGHDENSIGICLVGKDAFTPRQFRALNELVFLLKLKHSAISKIATHRYFDENSTCPNFNMYYALKMNRLRPFNFMFLDR